MSETSVRNCTTCPLLGKPERVRAIYVAGNASGLEWFECEGHAADDHPCGPRTRRETLASWRRTNAVQRMYESGWMPCFLLMGGKWLDVGVRHNNGVGAESFDRPVVMVEVVESSIRVFEN